MAWTNRQRQAIFAAFCDLFEIPTVGKPGQLMNFIEATKNQQLGALKPRVQAKRDENQASHDAAPAIAANAQAATTADNVELDDLLGTL